MYRIPLNAPEVIPYALRVLATDGVIAYPTDTAYGLGGNARSDEAVQKIYRVKQRTLTLPISVMVTRRHVEEFFNVPPPYKHLVDQPVPFPVTLITRQKGQLSPLLACENPSYIGFRIATVPVIERLLRQFDGAITATSANKSGRGAPYRVEDLTSQFPAEEIDLVIDSGRLQAKRTSTVIDLQTIPPTIVRPGQIF
jgi:L-threonylcarbamoyladenylate synthase